MVVHHIIFLSLMRKWAKVRFVEKVAIYVSLLHLLCFASNCLGKGQKRLQFDLNRTPSPEPQHTTAGLSPNQHNDDVQSNIGDANARRGMISGQNSQIHVEEPNDTEERRKRRKSISNSKRDRQLETEKQRVRRQKIRERQLAGTLTESDIRFLERKRKKGIRYREKNKVQIQEYSRRWRQKNARHNRDRIKQWKEEHPEKVKEYRAKHRQKEKEKLSQNSISERTEEHYQDKAKKWREENPEKLQQYRIKYREKEKLKSKSLFKKQYGNAD